MVARMNRRSSYWVFVLSASVALVAVADVGCTSRSFGPVPGPANLAGPNQRSAYHAGHARIVVRSPAHKTFRFGLEPSAVYPSPPTRLDLAFGELRTGQGVDIQVLPQAGTVPTSAEAVVALRLDVPHIGTFQGASMEGEGSLTLSPVSPASVEGSFDCRDIHQNVGTGATVAAAGTFSARS